jgi:iron(III) transport system substrate-binding protein
MRYVYLVLFLLVLGAPFVMRKVMVRGDDARRSLGGTGRLVIVTPHNGDIRREFARAFDAWHREKYGSGVAIDYRVPGGTTDMVRLIASTYAPYQDAHGDLQPNAPIGLDLVWGGGDFTFYHDLQPLGVLQPMHLDPDLLHSAFPADSLAGVRLFDAAKDAEGHPAPQWVGVCLSSFGIIYNPQLYQTLGLAPPENWADLTNPKLFGLVALADPAHSGSAAVSYMMVIQRAMADAEQALFADHPELKSLARAELRKRPEYRAAIAAGWKRGMGQLLLIAGNARYFTDSSEVVPTDVGRAEAAAGMAIDFYARVTEGTVGPERAQFVSPRAATAITPDPIAILRGTTGDRLTLATHFVEFLLSPEGQRLWILAPGEPGGPVERSPRRMPIRRDVYANQAGWVEHFDPFNEAGGFNQRGEWMALMSDTRPIWDAAWIDSRDALLAACLRIQQVRDPAQQAALWEQMRDVPVTMADVEQRMAERTRLATNHMDVYEWQARDRIAWGAKFRQHYLSVGAHAEHE